ncbi:MAG: hypothetical protein J6A47_02615 [Bacilli bacterium]|nr:hypothetical protein [Bacilli bacterium]
MFDKRLLIVPALVVSTVVVGTIYLSSDKNASQLSVFADPVSYSVTIDVDHPLLPTQDETMYAFRLHNAGAYGALKAPSSEAIKTLPEGHAGYVFSFTSPNQSFFSVKVKEGGSTDYEIGGVKRTLWGIPHPTKVKLVYNDGGKNLTANTLPYPANNWQEQQTEGEVLQNGDKSISYAIKDPSVATTSWDTSINTGSGTIYVRSMTIEYTCS